jgi:thiol:disulfide interchange protein DsbD
MLARIRTVACAFALVLTGTLAAHAAPVRTEHVEAELVADQSAVAPGSTVVAALRLRIAPGWHTYWRNPGDSGLPTTLAWKLPTGWEAGAIEWPAPHALPAGPLVNYGYEGEVLHLVPLTVPKDAAVGSRVTLPARADWLVCRETCIPEGADLSLELPIAAAATPDASSASAIAATRAALPKPLQGWTAAANGEGTKIALALTPPASAGDPGTVRFFADEDSRIEPSAPQTLARDASGAYVLTLPVSSDLKPFTRLAGVVTASRGFGEIKAATLDVPLQGAVAPGPKPKLDAPALNLAPETIGGAPVTMLSLLSAALLAFVGGLILNLMPCVFPVLSLKALSLATPGRENRRVLRLQGVAFAVGVVATFVALAGLLLVFRAAGEELGWGFQLQSPAVVTVLAVLFFVLALNLSGVFEFATLVPSSAAGWTVRNPYADGLLSGVLAVVIASPCTAPFMGAALGFAIAQPLVETLAVFVALGLGMALPFLLLSVFPEWRRVLPRPGAWMERFKQLLAFPLYATVAWLAWVLGAQVDNDAVMRLLATLVVVAFALWAWRAYRGGGSLAWSVAAAVGLAAAVVVALPLVNGAREAEAAAARTAGAATDSVWQPYSTEKVAELTGTGRPVFVDFTAAWCVTCQVNKRLVLNTADVREAFATHNVALVRADWTRRDSTITAALGALGRNGVPVYVLYRPGREPLLLPEVLQKGTVIEALATLDAGDAKRAAR